jgi:hypothetical protein
MLGVCCLGVCCLGVCCLGVWVFYRKNFNFMTLMKFECCARKDVARRNELEHSKLAVVFSHSTIIEEPNGKRKTKKEADREYFIRGPGRDLFAVMTHSTGSIQIFKKIGFTPSKELSGDDNDGISSNVGFRCRRSN